MSPNHAVVGKNVKKVNRCSTNSLFQFALLARGAAVPAPASFYLESEEDRPYASLRRRSVA